MSSNPQTPTDNPILESNIEDNNNAPAPVVLEGDGAPAMSSNLGLDVAAGLPASQPIIKGKKCCNSNEFPYL